MVYEGRSFLHKYTITAFTLSEIQIVVMDPNDNILAIKQADSYVRRMQRRCAL